MIDPTEDDLLHALRCSLGWDEEERIAEIMKLIKAGPPCGSLITRENWRLWHTYEWFACPGQKNRTCDEAACGIGGACRALWAPTWSLG